MDAICWRPNRILVVPYLKGIACLFFKNYLFNSPPPYPSHSGLFFFARGIRRRGGCPCLLSKYDFCCEKKECDLDATCLRPNRILVVPYLKGIACLFFKNYLFKFFCADMTFVVKKKNAIWTLLVCVQIAFSLATTFFSSSWCDKKLVYKPVCPKIIRHS